MHAPFAVLVALATVLPALPAHAPVYGPDILAEAAGDLDSTGTCWLAECDIETRMCEREEGPIGGGCAVWTAPLYSRRAPIAAGDALYALSNRNLTAVDRATGEILWTSPHPEYARVYGNHAVAPDAGRVATLVESSWAYSLQLHDATTGVVVHSRSLNEGGWWGWEARRGLVGEHDGRFLVMTYEIKDGGATRTVLRIVDSATGDVLKTTVADRMTVTGPFRGVVDEASGRFIVGGWGGLVAFDLTSGDLAWSYPTSRYIWDFDVGGGRVFAGVIDGHPSPFVALDAVSGALLWETQDLLLGYGPNGIAFDPTSGLVVAAAAGTVGALDPADGSVLWRRVFAAGSVEARVSDVAGGDGRAYVAFGSHIVALDPASASVLWKHPGCSGAWLNPVDNRLFAGCGPDLKSIDVGEGLLRDVLDSA